MSKFCYSCAAPLSAPEFKGPAEDYCKYCTDEAGNLRPKEEIKDGITRWLKSWQPDIDNTTATLRAEFMMQAMPAWADK